MKMLVFTSPLLLLGVVWLLPDTTWQSFLITQLPWLGFIAVAAWSFRNGFSEGALRGGVLFAAAIGLGYATYLYWSWSSGVPAQCSTGGCERAQSSEYADLFFGIRTALVGMIGYSLVILSLLLRGNWGRSALAFLATFGFGVSLYLTFSSVTVLQTTCQWCLGSAAAMTTLFVLAWWRMWCAYE